MSTQHTLTLKRIVEKNDTAPGKTFDIGIQLLIVISLVTFSIETLPDLSLTARKVLKTIEVVTVLIFTGEYLLRLIVADRKLKFVFSFFGLIDLIAIVPFYISTGIDLRSIRVLRMLRLFRIFKILRYSKAITRFHLAFKSIKEELVLFVFTAAILVFVASIGIYYFENKAQPEHFASFFHALWWSIVTLTTVGYGDVYPITTAGRVFASVVMLIGIGVVAVPSGLIASALTRIVRNDED